MQASIQALQEKHKSDMKNLEGLHHSTMMEFQSLEVKLASSKETVKHLKRKLEERERELLREKQEVKRLKEVYNYIVQELLCMSSLFDSEFTPLTKWELEYPLATQKDDLAICPII